ncbi:MAG: Zn-dependent exopeptidase M28 [Anaerolineae bacterium]|nr:MAG: Zn-dependent exopeptidase M28 [Anaerolineae bacterium]
MAVQPADRPGLQYHPAVVPPGPPINASYNVIGEIAGRTRPQDVYIVGGHFDSTSPAAQTNAPGAEDNASGAAGVLEMARILADYPPQATVRFIAFSGEEQGLDGSEYYVSQLSAAERARIKGVFIMDMIGYKSQAYPLNVLLESSNSVPGAVSLVTTLNTNAQTYTALDVDISYYPWGSDHVPFLDVNIPTVLLIEQEYDSYPCYHKTCDTPDKLTPRRRVRCCACSSQRSTPPLARAGWPTSTAMVRSMCSTCNS